MPGTYKESFKKPENESIELSVYNCGLQRCSGGYTWGPGVRDHYLIHLVTAGKGSYTVEGTQYTIAAGNLFFAKPNQRISYTADLHTPWEYYWVGFNGTGAPHLVQNSPFAGGNVVHHCAQTSKFKELLHNIYLARGPATSDETRMVGYLHLFMALLMEEAAFVDKKPPLTGAQYVINAVKFIQFNYSQDIGVDDIAGAVGVSRSHLYRVFMNNLGRSPIEYLTLFRIDEACSLLENTSLTIAEIAYSVGFFDQFYFSRVFKKTKGVPPSQYQRRK